MMLNTAGKISISVILILLLPSFVGAQDTETSDFPLERFYAERKSPSIIRLILTRFTGSMSIGLGNTFFYHELNNLALSQSDRGGPVLFSRTNSLRYKNWVNTLDLSADATVPNTRNFLVHSDSTTLAFMGNAFTVPLRVTVHYEFAGRYRIGLGYSYEFLEIGEIKPVNYKNKIHAFKPSRSSGAIHKYFLVAGVSFYRWNKFLFTADLNVGGFMPSNNFNLDLISPGMYINGGVSIEYEFSEYMKGFVRPSFELKNYTLSLPEGGEGILHHINALSVSVGLSYRLPKLPRCFHPYCHAQINHAHGDREYRSRVQGAFKKQNAGYGENYQSPVQREQKKLRKH